MESTAISSEMAAPGAWNRRSSTRTGGALARTAEASCRYSARGRTSRLRCDAKTVAAVCRPLTSGCVTTTSHDAPSSSAHASTGSPSNSPKAPEKCARSGLKNFPGKQSVAVWTAAALRTGVSNPRILSGGARVSPRV
ncbi:hypothetical protein DIPPA_12316 [Diplonema papillatum]|nr:hypothetical protein DIPPA_03652 [Diplonema papillatum]KAJ9436860.1 hypothetical protein DIPPA_12316 [Diplonema papillatum]